MAVILAFDFLRFGCKCFWIDLNWHASAHQFFDYSFRLVSE